MLQQIYLCLMFSACHATINCLPLKRIGQVAVWLTGGVMLSGCLSAGAAMWLVLALACDLRLEPQSPCLSAGGAYLCCGAALTLKADPASACLLTWQSCMLPALLRCGQQQVACGTGSACVPWPGLCQLACWRGANAACIMPVSSCYWCTCDA